MKKSSSIFMEVLAILTMLVVGCSVPAFPGSATQPPAAPVPQPSAPATGTIEVWVTDAPAGYEVTSIMVTIAEDGIRVHRAGSDNQTEGEWITIPITGANNPFDLKQLEDVEELLGSGNMTAGKYTQIRMDIEMVEVTYLKDGEESINTVNATLPSGTLKFVRPFEVVENETTVLLLDFDAEKSVIFTGAEDRVIVRPVVKLMVSQGTEPLEITTTSLPDGEVGTSYNATVEASGGTEPYTWNISGGSLPDGLTIDADTGVISGNATADGDFDFTVRVRDDSTPRLNDTEELSIHIGT